MIDFVVGLFHRLAQAGSILYWLLGALAVLLLALAVVAIIRAIFRFIGDLSRRIIEGIRRAMDATWRAIAEFAENTARLAVGIVVDLSAHEYGQPSVEVLFRATTDEAERAVRSRLVFLQDRGPGRSVDDVEAPPGLRAPPPQDRVSRSAGAEAARSVRRAWEIGHPNLMLHGRVRDAVACIAWQGDDSGARNEVPTFHVGIRRLRWWEARAGDYPWIVEIGTDRPAFFRDKLRPLAAWLGVSVGLTAPMTVRLQAACGPSCAAVSDGTIASTVGSAEGRYLMTCAHVTPPPCCATQVRGDFLNGDEPDVLLLRPGVDCSAGNARGQALRPADPTLIDDLISARNAVSRWGGPSRRRAGRIHYANMSYAIGERLFRFPACIVRVRRLWYFWVIPWPLVGWRFSKPGDSGSVVTCPDIDGVVNWIGMIHAGEKGDSMVLLASPLMAYLRKCLALGSETPLDARTL